MVYNTTTNAWVSGTVSFSTTTWPNDTVVFTPAQPLGNGVYLAIATGYDAATGGTQSLVSTWNFTVATTPVPTTVILEPKTATMTVGQTLQMTVTVKDQLGNPMAGVTVNLNTTLGTVPATVATGADGTATFNHTSDTAGTAVVTATAGSASDTSTITWQEELPPPPPG
jgi:hypothetical protein